MLRRVIATIAFLLAVGLATAAPPASADRVPSVPASTGSMSFGPRSGDNFLLAPTGTRFTFYAAAGEVIVEATPQAMRVSGAAGGQVLTIELAGANGGPLRPGTFAAVAPAAAGKPYARMGLVNRVCTFSRSTVTLSRYEFTNGHPVAIKASLQHYCEGASVPTDGAIDIALARWPAPVTMAASIDPTITVDPETGSATASGQITCSRAPEGDHAVYVSMGQVVAGAQLSAAFSVGVPCRPGGNGHWAITLRPDGGGRYVAGVPLSATLASYYGDSYYPDNPASVSVTRQMIPLLPPTGPAATRDAHGDVWAVSPGGDLYFYAGDGRGAIRDAGVLGTRWGDVTALAPAGDWDGDGSDDLIGRIGGDLVLLRSLGDGHLTTVGPIGTGWDGMDQIVVAGRLGAGPTRYVVARRRSDATLWRYAVDGDGRLRAGVQIGTGWGGMRQIVAPGDFTGDGRADLLGLHSNGNLYVYAGTEAATLGRITQAGTGWSTFHTALVPGDLTGDGLPDLLGFRADGILYRYNNLGGQWGGPVQIGVGFSWMRLVA